MKRFNIVVFICLNVLIANAQTEKRKVLVTTGSNISVLFSSNTLEYDGKMLKMTKTKQISFEPSIGVFVGNNFALGLSVPLEYSKNSEDLISTVEMSYGIAPFIRYYFNDSKVRPYFNFDFGYLKAKTKSNVGTPYDDTYGVIIADAGVGVSAFFTENVAFDTQLVYGMSRMVYKDDTDLKIKTFSMGFIIGITVTF